MSKKRLYEIAKELGKESKEIVARAKELGLDVKSHSSSVEAAAAEKIAASFTAGKKSASSVTTAAETKLTEAQPVKHLAPAKVEVADSPTGVKSAPQVAGADTPSAKQPAEAAPRSAAQGNQETAEPTSAPKVARPQSRNFKAEREARAKEEAERRKQQGQQKPQRDNRERQERRNDRNDRNRQDRRNRPEQGSQNRPNQQRSNYQQNQSHQAVNQGPRIDFKARAEALKAEQNAEYARSSEERFKQAKADKEAFREQNKRKEEAKLEDLFVEVETQTPAAPTPAPAATAEPAVDTRRKKQARPDKRRDDLEHEEDGPKKQQKNRSSQNQVRNQKNSNWNTNKKNKKGKNNRNNTVTPKPVTERKFHELPTEFEYTDGMTVDGDSKPITRWRYH